MINYYNSPLDHLLASEECVFRGGYHSKVTPILPLACTSWWRRNSQTHQVVYQRNLPVLQPKSRDRPLPPSCTDIDQKDGTKFLYMVVQHTYSTWLQASQSNVWLDLWTSNSKVPTPPESRNPLSQPQTDTLIDLVLQSVDSLVEEDAVDRKLG